MGISGNDLVKSSAVDVSFREVRASDLKGIVRIEKVSFPDPWTPSQLLFEIIHEYSYGLVAETNKRIAGYIFAMMVKGEGHIGNLAVAPEFRGMGIGRKLLNIMLNKMRDKGITVVFLEVRKSNQIARNLYLTSGFSEIGIRKKYYHNGEDAIIMMKELRNARKSSFQ